MTNWIADLPIPQRTKNALEAAGYFTLESIRRESLQTIALLPQIGAKGIEKLKPYVLSWKDER